MTGDVRRFGARWPAVLAVVAVGGLGLVGCDASSGEPDEPTRARVVNTEITLTAPKGFYVAECWLPDQDGRAELGQNVAVVVPDGLRRERSTAQQCVFTDSASPETHALSVRAGVDESLGRFRERYVDPYEAESGDDGVAKVTADDAATIFDGRTGQTLAFDSYNDGEQRHQVIAQFEDVRLSWSVPADGFPDATYDDSEQRDGIATVQIVEDAPRPVRK